MKDLWRVLLALVLCATARSACALDAQTLGVVINTADPDSLAVGEYFVRQRAIPARNVVRVVFEARSGNLSPEAFAAVDAQVRRALPGTVQALALAWTRPWQVGCLSVTSAFAFGYDAGLCAEGCRLTPRSRYFDSDLTLPFTELGLRPAMLLAGSSVRQAQRTIDAGVSSATTRLQGTAYLLHTADAARNVRAAGYPAAMRLKQPGLEVVVRDMDALYGARDVQFYFIGRTRVDGLDTLTFRPGAIADHLTSNGGTLLGSPQMSALAWLDAGATASYGTVVEPCAFPQKFPQPAIVIRRYLAGETLIEAYWKSVSSPSQGVFVGEPLARIGPH